MIGDMVRRGEGESPAVARRRLRLALRHLRESLGLTQAAVSEGLRWSLSKVNRIETGEVTVSASDLEAMLTFFGISDGQRLAQLARYCRLARRRGWWDRTDVRPHLTPALTNLLQFHSDAVHIRAFGPTLFPGVIQVERMAVVLLAEAAGGLTEDQKSTRLDLRMRLRAEAIGAEGGPSADTGRKCTVVLDESVVLREFGGLGVLAQQLRDVLAAIDHRRLDIRILPFADPTLLVLEAPFMLVELDDGDIVLYREGMTDEFFDDGPIVEQYRQIFERQLAASLTPRASELHIRARLAEIEAALERAKPA